MYPCKDTVIIGFIGVRENNQLEKWILLVYPCKDTVIIGFIGIRENYQLQMVWLVSVKNIVTITLGRLTTPNVVFFLCLNFMLLYILVMVM